MVRRFFLGRIPAHTQLLEPHNQFIRTDYPPVQIGNTFALTVLLMCMIVCHTVV